MKCEACDHENIDGARFCAGCGALLPTEHEGDDPMVGQLVGGRYRVTGVLGEGGMGIVYIGEQQMGSTVRKVAIKTLHQHLSKDSSVLARFHRECGTVAQLEHPNTIKFYDFGATDDGTLYIAMEFVEGKPLCDIIESDGALPPDRVVHIMRQVAGALDEAHEQSIIHRDLKPENIILGKRAGEDDFVKVLDFGIAARTESADQAKEQKLTQQGMVLGTPPYMSPEQFTGKALDRRSDIYSLGVMAYEMLTGQLPFEADTPWQWATEHMTAQPRPFEAIATGGNIPPSMRHAIMKALAKDPDQRQSTARQFFEELTEGGRMTVESHPGADAAAGSGGRATAAMEAAPDFAPGAAPGGYDPPPGIGGGYGPPPGVVMGQTPGPMVAGGPPGVAVPHPPGGARSGGGKGLVIGLGAVGAVLLIAIVVVAASTMKPEDDVPPLDPLNATTSATPSSATIAPEVPDTDSTSETGTTGEAQADPPPEEPKSPKTPVTQKKDPPPKDPGPADKPQPPKDPEPPKQPSSSGACDACVAAAKGGNLAAAAQSFGACNDPRGKQQCQFLAKRTAASVARSGDCSQIKVVAAAANRMGAGSGQLNQALAKCQ